MTIKGILQVSIAIVKAFLSIFGPKFGWSRDLWIGGRWWFHICIPWPRLAYSIYGYDTMTLKGSLQVSIPIVKAFLMRNFPTPIEIWRKICVLGGKCLNVKFYCRDPQKAYPCAMPHHLTYWSWKSVQGSWLYAPGSTKKLAESLDAIKGQAHFRIFGRRRELIVSWWNFAQR